MLVLSEGNIEGVLKLRTELDQLFIKEIIDYWFELKKTPDERLAESKEKMAESAKEAMRKALKTQEEDDIISKEAQAKINRSQANADMQNLDDKEIMKLMMMGL